MNADKTKVEVRDEVEYFCTPVKHQSKQVGYAPRRKLVDLDEMLELFTPEEIFKLADRQFATDGKNKVRGKFTKDKIKASTILDAIANGTLKTDAIMAEAEAKGIDFTKAGAALLGIGKDAEIKSEKIHWDIL